MPDLEPRPAPLAIPSRRTDDLLTRLTTAWLNRYPSPNTRAAYERDLRAWIGWCQGISCHPLHAQMADIDDWLASQREGGAAVRSIARRLSAVSSWYAYLIRNTAGDPVPLITHNPAATDARPNVDRDASRTVGLDLAEADKLIAAADADGLRSSAIIRLLLTNAYRCGVIITAQVTDLGHDRGHRVLTVRTKGRLKSDPLPPPTAHAIDLYLAARGNPESGLLFVTRTGGRMAESYLWKMVRRLARKAGLPAAGMLAPHSLRHTSITEALDVTNGNIALVQDFAGHADPRTTQAYNRRRNQLDGHAAYLLGARYGTRDPGGR